MISALFGSFGAVVASDLPACPSSGYFHNCFGTYTYSDGSKYVGEWKDGNLNGQGTLTYGPNSKWAGDKYVGEFKDDKRHGQGTYTHSNGEKYVGGWKDNKRHGQGTYTYRNGDKYVGEFKDGKFNGEGIKTYVNGRIEEGVWKDWVFQYAKKTPYSYQPSVLHTAFNKLSKNQRKQVQSNLKDLGFYRSSIDGLYGKGTAGALTAYNRQNLNGADLNKSENAKNLINAVLGLKPAPKAVPDSKSDDTYKVASGSGFYVSEQGHIITNHHVIDGCQDIKVHSKGKVLETIKIADDKRNDLALLKISETPKHAFALSTESPFPLQDIVVAGYPFGDKVSSTLKFTQGVVSSIAGLGNDYSQIQIDAALQPATLVVRSLTNMEML